MAGVLFFPPHLYLTLSRQPATIARSYGFNAIPFHCRLLLRAAAYSGHIRLCLPAVG